MYCTCFVMYVTNIFTSICYEGFFIVENISVVMHFLVETRNVCNYVSKFHMSRNFFKKIYSIDCHALH